MRSASTAAVVVERVGVIDRLAGGQRAEAGVEVVEARVDQLQRQDLDAEPLAEPLVAPHVAADAVAGEQRLAAEQGVAGPLEVAALGGRCSTVEAVRGEPGVEVRRLALRGPRAGTAS